MWQQKVTYINLVKSDKGLGFSLIDYQHNQFTPMSKTMVVVRALVPSGVAQIDGRLHPGQRLVSINNTSLDDDLKIRIDPLIDDSLVSELTKGLDKTLDLLKYAVAILKSLPSNVTVRLGVQKPLPYPEAIEPTPKRAKSQIASRKKLDDRHGTKSSSYSIKTSLVSAEQTSRKKKKKNLKRRKKIISTSHYDLQSEDESESVIFDNYDANMKLSKNSEMLKTLNRMEVKNEDGVSKSEYDETTDNVLKDSSSLTLSSNEETIKEKYKYNDYNNMQSTNETDCNLTSAFEDDREDRIFYGLMATSAPAILNDLETLEKQLLEQKGHPFYSTSSLVKAQSRNYLSHIKAKSEYDMKNLSSINRSDQNTEKNPGQGHLSEIEDNEENKITNVPTDDCEQPELDHVVKAKANLTPELLALLQDSSISLTVSNVDLKCQSTAGNLEDEQFISKIVAAESLLNRIMQSDRGFVVQEETSAAVGFESVLCHEIGVKLNKVNEYRSTKIKSERVC